MGICGGDGFGLDTSNTFCKICFAVLKNDDVMWVGRGQGKFGRKCHR